MKVKGGTTREVEKVDTRKGRRRVTKVTGQI
jgi:hypothetical protein